MAVINCPACSKKISDKSKTCTHCGIEVQGADHEKLASIKIEQRIKTQQSLMNQSFIALLLFCSGFLYLFWQNAQPGTVEYIAAITCTIIGFCWYIINRVRILLVKRKAK